MNAGTVLLFKDFVFKDGGISPQKLVLILAVPHKKDQTYLCCLATSKQHYKSAQLGCHYENNFYYIDAGHSDFDVDTWIIFDKIYEFTSSKLLTESFKNGITILFDLKPDLWRAVRNCVVKSEDVELAFIERIKKQ